MSDSSYRESHQEKGFDYQQFCESNPHAKLMWRLESQSVLSFIGGLPLDRRGSYLDFACGTGRVHRDLMHLFQTTDGVDISAKMLEVARARAPQVRHHHGDITIDPTLVPGPFDFITAFRFFLNAEPALRSAAMGALRNRMHRNSLLVFNNHRNAGSLTHRLLLARGRSESEIHFMSEAEVNELLRTHSLRIVRQVGFGVLPSTEKSSPIPTAIAFPLERFASRLGGLKALASDMLYVVAPA